MLTVSVWLRRVLLCMFRAGLCSLCMRQGGAGATTLQNCCQGWVLAAALDLQLFFTACLRLSSGAYDSVGELLQSKAYQPCRQQLTVA